MAKELTPRQIREQAAYEAEKITDRHNALMDSTIKPRNTKPGMTAADRMDFYRRQAGWPPIRRS